MQDVELLEGEPERAGGGTDRPDGARSRQTLRWWLVGGAAALVAVLVTGQWVIRAREDAAVARLAAVAGVVAPVDGPLKVGRRYAPQEAGAVYGQPNGGLVQASDGSLTYQWGGGSHREPGWSKQLLGPVPAFAGAYAVNSASQCVPEVTADADVSTASRVVCLITDGGMKVLGEDGNAEPVPATTTFIEVLDTAAGAPLAQWPAPDAQAFALLDGQIVLGAAEPDADVFTGRDLLTGEARWTHEVAVTNSVLGNGSMLRSVAVSRVGDLLSVRTSSGELRLLSPDGHVVREGLGGDGKTSWDLQADSSGHPFLVSWDEAGTASVTLLGPDADPAADRPLPGSIAALAVDDGSLPGLLLTADSALHAWDARSGAQRWSSTRLPNAAQPSTLVVRGRVFLLSPTGLGAVDGRTGKTLWQVKPDKHLLPATVFTDARHLLVGYEHPGTDAHPVIVAYDFADGSEVSRVPYPTGIGHLVVWEGKLIGYDEDYTNLALLS